MKGGGSSKRRGRRKIEIDGKDQDLAKTKVDDMCKKLLVNLIIEDYKVSKI